MILLPGIFSLPTRLPIKPIFTGLALCSFYICMIPAGLLIDQLETRPVRTRRRGESADGTPLSTGAVVCLYGGAFLTREAMSRINRLKTGGSAPGLTSGGDASVRR